MLAPANFFRVGQTLAYKQLNKQIPNFLGICLSNRPQEQPNGVRAIQQATNSESQRQRRQSVSIFSSP